MKVSSSMRERLLGQKKALTTGFFIDKKNFTSGLYRLLKWGPNEDISATYISFYCERLKKGSTSPATFGLRCPLIEWFERLGNRADVSKEERDAAYKSVKKSTEYWMALIDVKDLGTPERPNIRCFRAPRAVYLNAINRMTDDTIGEDITDLVEGRPVYITKQGTGIETQWAATWMDAGPICDDADYVTALAERLTEFDMRAKFYAVKWDDLAEMYQELTGEEMPDEYRHQTGADAGAKDGDAGAGDEEAHASAPVAASKSATGVPAKKAPVKAAPTPAAKSEPAIVAGVTRTKFVSEGEEVFGTVTAISSDAEGALYEITDESGGEWTCRDGEFEIVKPEPVPEPTAGPKKGPSRAAPAATEVAAPAKGVPIKPGTGVPAKPASSGLKAKLEAAKQKK